MKTPFNNDEDLVIVSLVAFLIAAISLAFIVTK